MSHTVVVSPYFRKSLLALAVAAIFTPYYAHALDLAQSPPGTVDPYVAPNVIISIDDSGSMGFRLNAANATGANNTTIPNNDGTWPASSRRMNVLKYALKQVFTDQSLLPDKKIRLSWQAMWNNGNSVKKYNDLDYWYGGSQENPGRNKTPGANNVGSGNKNSMKILDATHRSNFIEFVDYLLPQNGTPSHLMFKQADDYLRTKSNGNPVVGGPWATNPGGNDALSKEFLGCRRNYHIMMTDGRWNGTASGGNQESQSTQLPDGTQYTANSSQTRVYYDNYTNTLSDWAFYSWSNNLQPSIYDASNSKKQISLSSDYRKAPDSEVIGNVKIDKYWNPKYNPANWPHLVTYTIGFSDEAITWPGASSIQRPSETTPFGYDGSFPNFVNGTAVWPEMNNENRRALDLWHAAINGRGRFYAVSKGEDLEKAFREIIGVINTQAEPDRSSAAISGMSYQDKPVGMFITSNLPKEAWKGEVRGVKLELTGQTDLWGSKTTAQILDATSPSNRVIVTLNDSSTQPAGIPFRWSNLSTAQQKCFNVKPDSTITANCSANTSVDTKGEQRLNYLRGDRTLELANSNGVFRNRQSRQGDIVNSNVWYTGTPVSNYALTGYAKFTADQKNRLPMIYVGGNDGMLHGFSVEDGTEKIAYVPRAVQANLTRLTWPSFDDNHRYFVDGSPMSGDVDINDRNSTSHTPAWRTMLVSALGAGGKGYFVLDVTNPSNFSENNASALVVMDKTLHSEETINCSTTATDDTACVNTANADIGHIFATPSTDDSNPLVTGQITLLNNNRWAAIMGNGYNSKNGRPVLLIQYLDGNKELLRLPATAANATGANVNDNGLSAPRLVDINNDGRPDVVYAGDLKGNMWKFMIASKSSNTWGVAFNGDPLFTARGGTAGSPATRTLVQPITAPPTVRANDRTTVTGTGTNQKVLFVGGMMVAFGTGRNVTNSDPDNTDSQTLYSVLDNTRYTVAINADDKQSYVSVHPGDSSKSIPAPTPLGTGLNSESKQTLLAQQKVGDAFKGQGKSEGREYWQIDPTSATGSPSVNWNTQRGWYLDLPATGERLLKPMSLYDGSNILAVYTQVPAKGSNINQAVESCEASAVDEERQFLTMLNIMDGKRPSVQLMDMNGDGFYDLSADHGVSRMRVVKGAHRIIGQVQQSTDYGKGDSFNLARMPEQSMRPSWRQLK
ncbi:MULTISPECIES: pilus assembly protein [Comamonas]|uniref:pilus assembly protein n=1 Tax=Comamonas TaxID=283 RepID=UPI00257D0E33|nr:MULTISPECIES: PilC/PilY family type IV pilus protein [Comamonas]